MNESAAIGLAAFAGLILARSSLAVCGGLFAKVWLQSSLHYGFSAAS